MLRHPGGEEHSRQMIALADLNRGSKWLDMGAGDGEAVRLLKSLGYEAEGIDLKPRGEAVTRGDYLHAPYEAESFDGILSQCSFYVSGDPQNALAQAARMLRKGGKLVLSDVTEDPAALAHWCSQCNLKITHMEDLTPIWREYYLEALWIQDNVCLPMGKKFRYVLLVCERV